MLPQGATELDVRVAGGKFRYIAAGSADDPLVLCFHGFPDQPSSFGPLMIRLVEAGYRVAAPWMRGYRPSVTHGPYHLDRLARDILELAHALSPERPVHAIGHDWGAAALYRAMAEAPARFAAAVTMAVPHPAVFLRNLRRQPAQIRRSWYMLFFQLPGLPEFLATRCDLALIDRLWRTWSPDFQLGDQARDQLHTCLRASMPAPIAYYRALFRPLREALARFHDSARTERLVVPTLYMHGARDGCIAPELGEGQERLFAGPYERVLVDSAGHFLQLETPDLTASYIVDWLQDFPCPA